MQIICLLVNPNSPIKSLHQPPNIKKTGVINIVADPRLYLSVC